MSTHVQYSTVDLLARFGIADRVERYLDLLAEWNEKINLVSRETDRDTWRRLAADSIAALAVLEDDQSLPKLRQQYGRSLDIGSGGGFPAIPLALTGRINHTTCIDSTAKKIKVLTDMFERLSISGIAQQIRLEEWKSTDRFDLVTMRLVTLDIRLWKAIHRHIDDHGLFVYYSHPKFDFKPSKFHVKQRTVAFDNSDVVKQLTYVFR